MWLNHLIGLLCGAVLLHEYKMFRVMHTLHHRDTNNPEFDPDVWVFAKTPVGVFFKCLTIPFAVSLLFFQAHISGRGIQKGSHSYLPGLIGSYTASYSGVVFLVIIGKYFACGTFLTSSPAV